MASPILRITDGTTRINLISETYGFHLNSWRPRVPGIKNDGVFRDSPLNDGRVIVYRHQSNWIDTFELLLNAESQDAAILYLRDLRLMLDKAVDYWTVGFSSAPVWIEAKAANETNTRYGLIMDYRLEEEEDPYSQPFFSSDCAAAMRDLTLVIEHIWWQDAVPGDVTCADIMVGRANIGPTIMEFVEGTGTDDGYVDIIGHTIDNNSVQMAIGASIARNAVWECFMRFPNITITPRDRIFNAWIQAYITSFAWPVAGTPMSNKISYCLNSTNAPTTYAQYTGKTWTDLYTDYNPNYYSGALVPSVSRNKLLYTTTLANVSGAVRDYLKLPTWASGNAMLFAIRDNTSPATYSISFVTADEATYTNLFPRLLIELDTDTLQSVTTCGSSYFMSNWENGSKTGVVLLESTGAAGLSQANWANATADELPQPFIWSATDPNVFYLTNGLHSFWNTIVLDIATPFGPTDSAGQWQYWDGAAWSALTVYDTDDPDHQAFGANVFKTSGVKSLYFFPPTDWATLSLMAFYDAYWVRFVETVGALNPIYLNAPPQATTDSGFVVDTTHADLPSLLKLTIHNTLDTAPGYAFSHTILCSRSLSRSTHFTPFLPVTDTDSPEWLTTTVSAGDHGVWAAATVNIPGQRRACYYGPVAAGSTSSYETPMTMEIDQMVGGAWAGRLKAFLAFHATSCVNDEFYARLRIEAYGITLTGAWGNMGHFSSGAVHLIDLGTFNIVPIEDAGDLITIYVDAFSSDATPGNFYIDEIVLLPADELYASIDHFEAWSDEAYFTHDSATNPKVPIESISWDFDVVGTVRKINTVSSVTRLQVPPGQLSKVWFFSYLKAAAGYLGHAFDNPFYVEVENVNRFYSGRGSA